MKTAKPVVALIALALLAASVGCQNKKSETPAASVGDLTPAPVQPTQAPIAYTPPPANSTTVTPVMDSSYAGNSNSTGSISGSTYTVKHGDTLWKIAAARYGDGKQYTKIVAANPGLSASKLRVGQTITLP